MNWFERMHFLHRAWRYRLRSEKFGLAFMRSRKLRGATVVDIGANRGIYSYWMCDLVGPQGNVIAFEPQPELVEKLKALRNSFRLDRLELAPVGLSSHDTELTLRRPRDHWAGASFESHVETAPDLDSIQVQVKTLDGYFARHQACPISFIKCDVEGHEHQVFRGGERILQEDRPELLFECHDATDPNCAVFSYLESIGYEGYCFFERGFAPIAQYRALRPKLHKKALADFVFVPKERSLSRAA